MTKRLLFLFAFLFPVLATAQDNSVELRDAADALVSSHNSLQAAYNAIPSPMTQGYRIVIQQTYTGANETYPISFTQKDGASASQKIQVYPAAGVTMVTVGGTPTNAPSWQLDGADYVVINGNAGNGPAGSAINMTIQNLATTGSNSSALRYLNGATNNHVMNCKFAGYTQLTAGPRTVEFQLSANNPEGNSDNLFEYNEVFGGRSGIGIAGTAANPNKNIVIRNNRIYDFGFAGIWVLSGTNSFEFTRNEIYQTQFYNAAHSGLNIAIVLGTNKVAYNKIYNLANTSTSTLRGITVSSTSNGGTLQIYNNMISLALDNGTKTSVYGVQLGGAGDYTAELFYNTIYIGGAHTGGTAGNIISAGFVKSNTGDTSSFYAKNNLIINRRTGGTAGALHTGSFISTLVTAGTLDIDYNIYYGADSAALHAGWGGFVYNSITQYRDSAAPHEQNSNFVNASFVDSVDLHLAGASLGDLRLAGTPVAWITDDIDGNTRDASKPYVGADEGLVPLPVELASFSANVNENNVILTWTTVTELNSKSFVVERMISGGSWTAAGEIAAAGYSTEIRTYSFTDRNVAAGSYSYRLKTVDFDGSYEYSPVVEVSLGVPSEFAVSQNYPNPFNPATTVDFQLPADARVTLELYSVTGEKVASLLNGSLSAGYHKHLIDAASLRLTSGIYIYRFTAVSADGKEFRQVRKMTLLK
ncbi:MAG: hypothetical protein FMNOHCHN_01838 [Ignavibacteriaceae bacterium]|nr:hypothetical protein [Ignavibacteriaceae bacterium]